MIILPVHFLWSLTQSPTCSVTGSLDNTNPKYFGQWRSLNEFIIILFLPFVLWSLFQPIYFTQKLWGTFRLLCSLGVDIPNFEDGMNHLSLQKSRYETDLILHPQLFVFRLINMFANGLNINYCYNYQDFMKVEMEDKTSAPKSQKNTIRISSHSPQ